MRHRGRVIRFFDKGYGFIQPEASGALVVSHLGPMGGLQPHSGSASGNSQYNGAVVGK
jgi:hypothetical protein